MSRPSSARRRRPSGWWRTSVTLAAVLVIAGFHMARRNGTDTNTSGGNDTTGTPGRTHIPSGSSARSLRSSTRSTATGSTARPRPPGTPTPTPRLPRGRTRKDANGNDITLDRKRDKPEVDHTKGFTEDLPAPTQNADGSWTINLRDHEGWKSADFELKANHLKQLGENDELTRNTNDRDPKNTREWRAEKEREIFWDATDQADLDARISELDSQQIDHAQDLQLNGQDIKDNMWGIDSATNHGMGLQINSQLSQVPAGATVRINIIPGVFTPTTT